jgi:hypothetical protein
MSQFHRLPSEFHRICLVTNGQAETIALVPYSFHAVAVMQSLSDSMKLRSNQFLSCSVSPLRPDSSVMDKYAA